MRAVDAIQSDAGTVVNTTTATWNVTLPTTTAAGSSLLVAQKFNGVVMPVLPPDDTWVLDCWVSEAQTGGGVAIAVWRQPDGPGSVSSWTWSQGLSANIGVVWKVWEFPNLCLDTWSYQGDATGNLSSRSTGSSQPTSIGAVWAVALHGLLAVASTATAAISGQTGGFSETYQAAASNAAGGAEVRLAVSELDVADPGTVLESTASFTADVNQFSCAALVAYSDSPSEIYPPAVTVVV